MKTVEPGGRFVGEPRPELSDLDRCTRCGLCEQACPTYRLLQFEPDSPRGRIFLMKEVAEGKAPIDAHLAEHLYRCLGCRACETACPSGVPFGKLLERGRYQIELHGEIDRSRRGFRRFRAIAFERVLPNRRLFELIMWPARALQSLPSLLRLAQSLPLPKRLRQTLRMIPRRNGAHEAREQRPLSAPPTFRYPREKARVALFTGCVMGSLFEHVHAATIDVLRRSGYKVVVPQGQWCCGALNLHAGERDFAARMAKTNVHAFAADNIDAIIVNSAGCGAVMKAYDELLPDDPQALRFARAVRDATEYLADRGLGPGLGPLNCRVTYQDPCHLAHAQRIRTQPRMLLKQIPQLTFVEMAHADRCCGAAGVYSLTHADFSSAILADKINAVAATGADIVATANPGCAMQLQSGLLERRLDVGVHHVMELLSWSYKVGDLRWAGDRPAER